MGFGKLSPNPPHGPAELLVGHPGVLLPVPPHLGHAVRLHELEDAVLRSLPADQRRVGGRVQQQVTDELPQLAVALACEREPTCDTDTLSNKTMERSTSDHARRLSFIYLRGVLLYKLARS